VPVRSCIGCRRRRPSSELVRITRFVDGNGSTTAAPAVAVDGPSSGRGAWLCSTGRLDAGHRVVSATCLADAIDRRQFARAWRTALDHDDIDAIRAALRTDEQHTD